MRATVNNQQDQAWNGDEGRHWADHHDRWSAVNGRFAEFLHSLGVPRWRAWIGALSGKGWWRMSGSPAMEGMTLAWFESQGLVSLTMRYEQLNR